MRCGGFSESLFAADAGDGPGVIRRRCWWPVGQYHRAGSRFFWCSPVSVHRRRPGGGIGAARKHAAHVPRQPLSGALRQYARLVEIDLPGPCPDRWHRYRRDVSDIAGSPFVFIKLYGVRPTLRLALRRQCGGFHSGWRRSMRVCWPRLAAGILAGARGVGVLPAPALPLLGGERDGAHGVLWPLLIRCSSAFPAWLHDCRVASACAMNGQGAGQAVLRRCSVACNSASPPVPPRWWGCCTMATPCRWPWSSGLCGLLVVERRAAHPALQRCPGAGAQAQV